MQKTIKPTTKVYIDIHKYRKRSGRDFIAPDGIGFDWMANFGDDFYPYYDDSSKQYLTGVVTAQCKGPFYKVNVLDEKTGKTYPWKCHIDEVYLATQTFRLIYGE